MPKLNEYLGSVVSSITTARLMSDLQTVKVAEQYAQHNLLKHFSIPRMRIEDIEMTIPIAIDQIIEKSEVHYELLDKTKFNLISYEELAKSIRNNISLDTSNKLRANISKLTLTLEENLLKSSDLAPLANYVNEVVSLILEIQKSIPVTRINPKININVKELSSNLNKILSTEIKQLKTEGNIENLNVIIEAHRLREQKSENIIFIKMKISEDSMEWHRSENKEGEIETRLLPE
jgi:hypothetical protein